MKKILHSQLLLGTIILLIQFGAFALLLSILNDYSNYIMWIVSILVAGLLVYEINRASEPSFKYAWLVLITVLPVFGTLFYIYVHLNVVTKKINERTGEIIKETRQYIEQDLDVRKELASHDDGICGLSDYIYNYGGYPTYKNTSVEYFSLGEHKFFAMKAELEKAKKFIFIEYFIINVNSYMWKEILEILKKKAKEGVEIRLMYDAMGSLTTFPAEYIKTLEEYGIKCRIFSRVTPFLSTYQNNRDHRKILVIDGETAFTGGINISDEYINKEVRFGHWKDTAVMVKGDAAVSFTIMFLQIWNISENISENYSSYVVKNSKKSSLGYAIPYADSPIDDENVSERIFIDIINRAKKYVHIMTPYLVISYEMEEALKYAAKRGVDVKIIMPHIPDKPYALWIARSYYFRLIRAGVKIFEYTNGFVHAKVTVSDDDKAIVGTVNYDYRSMYLSYECALLMYKMPCVSEIENDFMSTEKKCQRITMEEYQKFSIFGRIGCKILRLFAPLI